MPAKLKKAQKKGVSGPQTKAQPLFLAGEWVQRSTKVEVRSPYDNTVAGSAALATKSDFKKAIDKAEAAFAKTRELSSGDRANACLAIAEAIRAEQENFAKLMVSELGKAIKDCRVEVIRAISVFTIAAEEAKRIGGEILDLDWTAGNEGRFGLVRRFPIGVIGAITPFNFPLNLVAHKIAPAIASGNTIVLKPASKTPLIALKLAKCIEMSGYPKGGVSILPASSREAEPLLTDPRVKLLTFTGSSEVGWKIKQQAWRKKVVLDLGGNAGVIVSDDADLEWATTRIMFGGFSSAGQSCISVQRIFVHEKIFQATVSLLLKKVSKLRVGDPSDSKTDIGALVDRESVQRTMNWIAEAKRGGAKVLCGGIAKGNQLSPTVITGTKRSMAVCNRELFAPVVVIEPYKKFESAINEVNNSVYGLQAGLFTNRMSDILHAYERLEYGGVIVNDVPTWRVDQMPYGGVKESGVGREGIRYAISDMTEPKLLAIRPEKRERK